MDAKRLLQLKAYAKRFNPRARDGREQAHGGMTRRHYCFNPRARDGRECV